MTPVGFLGQLAWLSSLDPETRERVERSAVRHRHGPGATIFEPSETPRSVYILESGRARIFRLSVSGEEATLGYVAPGEVFGELPGFGAFPRESFARAQEASVSWRLRIDVFREVVSTHPDVAVDVTRQIARRMKGVEARIEGFILRGVRSRLASAFLEFAEHFGETRDGARCVDLRLSQAEIGTLIGASRQSVNAALGELRASGLLHQEGTTFTLPDPAGLRKEAGGANTLGAATA